MIPKVIIKFFDVGSASFQMFVTQTAHLAAAYGIVLTAGYIGSFTYAVVFACLMEVWSLVKEFWWDANYEYPPQKFWNNFEDWAFYNIGIALALTVVILG